jgi:hypothetical protein
VWKQLGNVAGCLMAVQSTAAGTVTRGSSAVGALGFSAGDDGGVPGYSPGDRQFLRVTEE